MGGHKKKAAAPASDGPMGLKCGHTQAVPGTGFNGLHIQADHGPCPPPNVCCSSQYTCDLKRKKCVSAGKTRADGLPLAPLPSAMSGAFPG